MKQSLEQERTRTAELTALVSEMKREREQLAFEHELRTDEQQEVCHTTHICLKTLC